MNKTLVKIIAIILAAILAVSVLVSAISALTAGAVDLEEIQDLKDRQAEIREKKDGIIEQIERLENDRLELLAQKQALDEAMAETTARLESLASEIQRSERQIEEQKLAVAEANAAEDRQWELYKSRLRAIEEMGVVSYLEVIFEASSFSDLLARWEITSSIMNSDKKLQKELELARQASQEAELLLEQYRDEQIQQQLELEQKTAELEEQIDESETLMMELIAAVSGQTVQFRLLDAEEAELRTLIAKYESENENPSDAQEGADGETGADPEVMSEQEEDEHKLVWPSRAGNLITSYYGPRIHPITGEYRNHNGVDIAAPHGTAVLAVDGGTVILATYGVSYGNYVMIDHGNGLLSMYAHMSKLSVSAGESVVQGQVIGLCGMTGYATGPHIHLEIYENGVRINPLSLYDESMYTVSPSA